MGVRRRRDYGHKVAVLPHRHVFLMRLLAGGNEDNFVQFKMSGNLTRGNEVSVVNGVERPTHDTDSSAGAFDRHGWPSGARIRSSRDAGCGARRHGSRGQQQRER